MTTARPAGIVNRVQLAWPWTGSTFGVAQDTLNPLLAAGTFGTALAAPAFEFGVWAPTEPVLSTANVAAKTTNPNVSERDFASCFMAYSI